MDVVSAGVAPQANRGARRSEGYRVSLERRALGKGGGVRRFGRAVCPARWGENREKPLIFLDCGAIISKVYGRMMKEWGDPLFCLLIRIKRKSRPLGRERVKRMSPAPKKKGNVAQRVWELSEPLAKELNLSLWDVQFVKEGADWFLRVFIDKEGGVSIDDCVDMTHALSPVLDKEDPIPQEYMLEVSSPGLERKLTRPEHFAAFVGRPVRARLIRPLENGQRELTGILLRAEEDGQLELQLDEETSVTLEKKECSSVHSVEEDFDEEEE